MNPGSFKNAIYKKCQEIIYFIYKYKKDFVLNNLQQLMCHKTKPNQTSRQGGCCFLWVGFFWAGDFLLCLDPQINKEILHDRRKNK